MHEKLISEIYNLCLTKNLYLGQIILGLYYILGFRKNGEVFGKSFSSTIKKYYHYRKKTRSDNKSQPKVLILNVLLFFITEFLFIQSLLEFKRSATGLPFNSMYSRGIENSSVNQTLQAGTDFGRCSEDSHGPMQNFSAR